MKKYRMGFQLLITAFLLCSCATVVVPPQWTYEPNAIFLNLKGDPQLHLYQGKSHALKLCVYFLTDPNELNQLVDEKGGLEKLCECTKFHSSVANVKTLVANPGRDYKETFDRPEGAKYVAVVAGYYNLKKENTVRLFAIPIVGEKKRSTLFQKPGPLRVDLYLSPQQIQEVKGK